MIYVYDIETLKNLFTATFVNAEDDTDKKIFVIGLGRDERGELVDFLRNRMTLVGYNNHSYDDAVLRFIMQYKGDKLNSELHSLSDRLVNDFCRGDKDILALRYPRQLVCNWKSVDLMKIMAFDKLGVSLKQVAINLKWHKIQDMPIDHTAIAENSQLEMILSYNLNDVLITKRLYEEIEPIRKLREELGKIYHVDFSSASDSKIANLILEHEYTTQMNVAIQDIKDSRTSREKVLLGACIAKFVKFETPQLQELLDRISATLVYSFDNYRYSEKVYFANCVFALGIGGLHSEDEPGVFVTDDKYIIQDMDVSSYYPNLIINNKFYPKHLGEDFITVLKKITEERIAAKKSGDKVKADGLKITVNSIFGKLGSPTFWLLDAKQMLSTTLSGQMGLLMLIEDLHLKGIEVISANTDGVVCKIPRDKEEAYNEVARNWEKETGLELEFTRYKKYVRRDVNSYITQKEDGKTKEKGAFLQTVDLKKAYHMPIVAKALAAYFIKEIPVRETLENCKDIMEFCISQKSGTGFGIELHTNKGIEHLQKTNRFYITNKGGRLIKRASISGKLTGLYVGNQVSILNEFDSSKPFEEYDVNLNFYESEVMKIIDAIEPPQLQLFDLTNFKNGGIIKQSIGNAKKHDAKAEKPMASELNKLGKNQFARKLESIVSSNQTVGNISPRYVYIEDFDFKHMVAEVYCLAKGTRDKLYVDKKIYKTQKIEKGQLVYCAKFEKKDDGYTMAEYRITEKIEEQREKLI